MDSAELYVVVALAIGATTYAMIWSTMRSSARAAQDIALIKVLLEKQTERQPPA